jgi:hypothetical protein
LWFEENNLNRLHFCSRSGKSLHVLVELACIGFVKVDLIGESMSEKPMRRKLEPLAAAIIAYMKPDEEATTPECAGFRVRGSAPMRLTRGCARIANSKARLRRDQL